MAFETETFSPDRQQDYKRKIQTLTNEIVSKLDGMNLFQINYLMEQVQKEIANRAILRSEP